MPIAIQDRNCWLWLSDFAANRKISCGRRAYRSQYNPNKQTTAPAQKPIIAGLLSSGRSWLIAATTVQAPTRASSKLNRSNLLTWINRNLSRNNRAR